MNTREHPAAGRKSDRTPASAGRPAGAPAAREAEVIQRMADKMREMGQNGVAVTADSLFENSDFTRDQIERLGRNAADLARASDTRQARAA